MALTEYFTPFSRFTRTRLSARDDSYSEQAFTAETLPKTVFRPDQRVHSGWKELTYNVEGTAHSIYDRPAIGETKADVLFMTGCGSDPLIFPRQINRDLAGNGYRVFAARQIHRDDYADNVDRNLVFADWLLTSDESPLVAERTAGKKLFIITNSSTKLIMDIPCLDRDKATHVSSMVTHFFDNSPFYDTARSAMIHEFQDASRTERILTAMSDPAYGWHGRRNYESFIGGTRGDRAFMWLTGAINTGKRMNGLISGTRHGEGIDYRNLGRPFVQELERLRLEEPDHPIFDICSTTYHGDGDPAASLRTSRYVAKLKGDNTRFIPVPAEHNPAKETPFVMAHIVASMDQILGYDPLPEWTPSRLET